MHFTRVFFFRFIPDGEHRDYVVPGSCTNGTIDWNYPKEYVIIHFKGEGHVQYSVCLGGNLGGDMFTLYDVTGDTKQAIPKGVHSFRYILNCCVCFNCKSKNNRIHAVKIKVK